MSNVDVYPAYIKVVEDDESDDVDMMELPTERDGTLLLSTILAQYPTATGLKYKTESGCWRGIKVADNLLYPPEEGWGETEYFITLPKQDSVKRKNISSHSTGGPEAKVVRKTTEEELLSDLIVLGLSYAATDEEFNEYFETFGELALSEIKRDSVSQESKGYGFIRYTEAKIAKKVIGMEHTLGGRRCEVRLPKKPEEHPMKLFIGRLKEGTTVDQLREHFSAYGSLHDVYIPKNFRGFGFVTFSLKEDARAALEQTHIIEGSCVNVTYAEPKSAGGAASAKETDTPGFNPPPQGGNGAQGCGKEGNGAQAYNPQHNHQGFSRAQPGAQQRLQQLSQAY